MVNFWKAKYQDKPVSIVFLLHSVFSTPWLYSSQKAFLFLHCQQAGLPISMPKTPPWRQWGLRVPSMRNPVTADVLWIPSAAVNVNLLSTNQSINTNSEDSEEECSLMGGFFFLARLFPRLCGRRSCRIPVQIGISSMRQANITTTITNYPGTSRKPQFNGKGIDPTMLNFPFSKDFSSLEFPSNLLA